MEHKDAKFNESEYENFEGTNNKWAWVAMAWVLHPHTSPHIPTHPHTSHTSPHIPTHPHTSPHTSTHIRRIRPYPFIITTIHLHLSTPVRTHPIISCMCLHRRPSSTPNPSMSRVVGPRLNKNSRTPKPEWRKLVWTPHTCIHTYTHTRLQTHTYPCIHRHIYTHTHTYTYLH
jgi:hypothetical protein